VGAIASIGVSACMGLGIGAVEGFIPAFFCF
jgi:hypothetical protein